ncbi:molybdate ABC transporter substrate-binding protein [Cedecea colo]|uniref:Molybdate ABC transporter substrate-binding protein n=1 Tax=Cedecea colo TaxID=2552946 RepID=A0ABX0VRC6_9ENTR|nr:molybdate ABC transporter substrate-binding protein [Cedecea colo]NIY49487.1 molybdate ABC transporter substrate-binding protein [Cedecea colo]
MHRIIISFFLTLSFILSANAANGAELHMYAGAGLRQPVDDIVKQFEQATGHRVVIEFGGSGQILTRFNLTKSGDLFLPGSADYVEKLRQQGLIISAHPLVLHTPVMVVRKKAGAKIQTLADLAKSNLKIGMGDPKAIALGKSGEQLLAASGYGQALKEKVVVQTTTIKQLLIYLLKGDVDAAVIGRSDAIQHQDSLLILPSPAGTPEEVATIAVLKTSTQSDIAGQLADYFVSEKGIKAFTDRGYLSIKK